MSSTSSLAIVPALSVEVRLEPPGHQKHLRRRPFFRAWSDSHPWSSPFRWSFSRCLSAVLACSSRASAAMPRTVPGSTSTAAPYRWPRTLALHIYVSMSPSGQPRFIASAGLGAPAAGRRRVSKRNDSTHGIAAISPSGWLIFHRALSAAGAFSCRTKNTSRRGGRRCPSSTATNIRRPSTSSVEPFPLGAQQSAVPLMSLDHVCME